MSTKEEMRIFVGGLSWNTTDRHLEDAFERFGKVIEAQMDFVRYIPACMGLDHQGLFVAHDILKILKL